MVAVIPEQFINQELKAALNPWKAFFLNHNPADDFSSLSIPVLSLNGTKDVQVDAHLNQTAIQTALLEGGNTNFKISTLEGLNHLFQYCETGAVEEYNKIEETLSPVALEEIFVWIEGIIAQQP